MTVYYSATRGKPTGHADERRCKVTWAVWWRCAPDEAPLCPDAWGGAPTMADVLELVRRGRRHDDVFRRASQKFAAGIRAQLAEGRMPDPWAARFDEQSREWDRARRAQREAARVAREIFDAFQAARSGPPSWVLTLGVSWPGATEADIKRAYRVKAAKAHPDAGGSHEAFLELTAARDKALAAIRGAV